jgi:hypothetical protein
MINMPVKIYLKEGDENPKAKIVKLEANTITFDGRRRYKLYRTTIPPNIIPEEFKNKVIAQTDSLIAYIKELKEKGISGEELEEKTEKYKEEIEFQKIHPVYIQIDNNLIIQSFILDKEKDFIYNEEISDKLVNDILGRAGRFFDKLVAFVPLETQQTTMQEFSQDISEAMKELKEQNQLYYETIVRFFRLMYYEGLDSGKFEGEKLFDEDVDFTDEMNDLIDQIEENDTEFLKKHKKARGY